MVRKLLFGATLCVGFAGFVGSGLFTSAARAQMEADFSAGGAVRVGDSTTTCDGDAEGAIRYDADGADTLDYCTGAGWVTIGADTIGDDTLDWSEFSDAMTLDADTNVTMGAFDLSFNNGSVLYIDGANNRVGIGTAAPLHEFSVVGSGHVSFHLRGGTGSSLADLRLMEDAGTGDDYGFSIAHQAAPNTFNILAHNGSAAGTEVFTIRRESGFAGFGTTSPDVLAHVEEDSAATDSVTSVARFTSTSSGTPAAGIGVGMEFEVETAANNNEIGAVIEAVTTDVTAASEDFDLVFKTMAGGAVASQVMRIESDGEVDITSSGGTSYNYPLQLRSSEASSGFFDFVSFHGSSGNAVAGDVLLSNLAGNFIISPNTVSKDLMFVGGLWTNTPSMVIKDGGNVGIGTTSPAAALHVRDEASSEVARFQSTSNDAHIFIYGGQDAYVRYVQNGVQGWQTGIDSSDSASFKISTGALSGNEVMTLTTEGSVAIGTTSPAATLEVAGTDAILLPRGTVAERPSVPVNGMMRYNSDNNNFDVYQNGGWASLATSASAAGGLADADGNTLVQVEEGPNDDTIRFDTGGSERLVIEADGDITVASGNSITFANGGTAGTVRSLGSGRLTFQVGGTTAFEARTQGLMFPNGQTIIDQNANEIVAFPLAASAVNYFRLANAATGEAIEMSAAGDDANIDLAFTPKGAGHVGIGTTSPDVLAHVEEDSAATDSVTNVARFTSTSSGTPAAGIGVGMEFEVETAADNNEIGAVIEAVTTDVTATSEDFDLVFSTMAAGAAADEAMRITGDGNVGLGSNVPITNIGGVALTIGGSTPAIVFDDESVSTSADGRMFRLLNNNGALQIYESGRSGSATTGSSFIATFDGDGNVGIGTSSPAAKLHIADTAATELRLEAPDAKIVLHDTSDNDDLAIEFLNNSSTLLYRLGVDSGSGDEDHFLFTNFISGKGVGFVGSFADRTDITFGIGVEEAAATLEVAGTDAILFPRGTVAERPSVPVNGMMRYNSDNNNFDVYQNGGWASLATSASSAGSLADADDNTQIQVEESPNEDSIRFDTAGSEKMVILSNGNVGIGTGSANKKLQVNTTTTNTSTVEHILRLQHSTSSTPAAGIGTGIDFSTQTASSNWEIGATIEAVATDVSATSEDFDIVFKTMAGGAAADEAMRITSAGSVGIGIDAPSSTSPLHVRTDVNAPRRIFSQNLNSGTTATAGFEMAANGVSAELTAYSSAHTATIGSEPINAADSVVLRTFSSVPASQLIIGTGSAAPVRLFTADTTRILIDATGNVGIGTSSPDDLLDVEDGSIRLSETSNSSYSQITHSNGDGSISLSADAGNGLAGSEIRMLVDGSERMRIDNSGNVGIGTSSPTSDNRVDIQGGSLGIQGGRGIRFNAYYDTQWRYSQDGYMAAITQNGGTGSLFIANSAASGLANGAVSTANRIELQADGDVLFDEGNAFFVDAVNDRVGVGTTSPTHSLALGSAGNGIAYYNTADTTNYERLLVNWSSNEARMFTTSNTLAAGRPLKIGASGLAQPGNPHTFFQIQHANGAFDFSSGINNAATYIQMPGLGSALSAGSASFLNVNPTISQSGTANYTALLVNPTESSVGSGDNYLARFAVGGSNRVVIDNAGNVGIGTETPLETFQIGNAFAFREGGAGAINLYFNSHWDDVDTRQEILGHNGGVGYGGYIGYSTATGSMRFHVGTASGNAGDPASTITAMTIDNAGNVGVGTAAPAATMHIVSSGGFADRGYLMFERTNNDADKKRWVIGSTSGTDGGGLRFASVNDAHTNAVADYETQQVLVLQRDGNIGIGTNAPNDGVVEVKGGTVCVDTNSDDSATSCITSESDVRLKKNIEVIQDPLAKISAMRGVMFDWRWDEYDQIKRYQAKPNDVGVIAQEVEAVLPEAMDEEIGGFKAVSYDRLVPLVIEGVKALVERADYIFGRVEALEAENDTLRAEVDALKAQNAAILERLDALEAKAAE